MKNSYYFPHDYHARHDPKLERLRMEIGPVGDGIYWDLVEMLYEEDGYLNLEDLPLYAKSLNTTEELMLKVVNHSNLFIKNGNKFYSETLLKRLNHINAKRRKARASAKLSHSANAERTQSERSAIKESKVKESKVKESKGKLIEDILSDLNFVLGTSYKPNSSKTQDLIKARFNEGFVLNDFKVVHRKMLRAWGTDEKMVKFLRPITLYGPKFESYLNQKSITTKLTPEGVKAYLIGQSWLKSQETQEVIDVK